jgi:hypothetical protein
MSQYFSRLAQRSGINEASAPSLPSAHPAADAGGDAWLDAATETIALGAPSSAPEWLPGAGDFAQPATLGVLPERQIAAQGTAPSATALAAVQIGGVPVEHPPVQSIPDGANFLAHVRSVSEQWRSVDATGAAYSARPVVSKPPVGTAPAGTPSRSSASVDAGAPAGEGDHTLPAALVQARVAAAAPAATRLASQSLSSAPRRKASTAVAAASGHIDALTPARERAAADHISARAPAAPALPVERPAPVSTPSLQVHIGRIELEVHAPAAPAAAAPPAVAPVPSPAVARDVVFSAHRHYLRVR